MLRLVKKAEDLNWQEDGKGYYIKLQNGYTIYLVPNKSKFDVHYQDITLNYIPLSLDDAKQVAEQYIRKDFPEYKLDESLREYYKQADEIFENNLPYNNIKDEKLKAFIKGYIDMGKGKGYNTDSLFNNSLEEYYQLGYKAYRDSHMKN